MASLMYYANKSLRLWKFSAALVLLLVACIEAGHIHSTLLEKKDNCVLCHVNLSLDKTLPSQANIVIAYFCGILEAVLPCIIFSIPLFYFAPIRAPPVTTPHP